MFIKANSLLNLSSENEENGKSSNYYTVRVEIKYFNEFINREKYLWRV